MGTGFKELEKLLEVGVSPYLRFIPVLSTLQMFESKEAVRGRLIMGPNYWKFFWNPLTRPSLGTAVG